MARYRYPRPHDSEITPESVYHERRRFLRQSSGLLMGAALGGGLAGYSPRLRADWLEEALDSAEQGPYTTDETLTDFDAVTSYNNFYEFGTRKRDPSDWGHQLSTDPWSVTIDGEVEKAGTFDFEDIVRPHTLEERVYRLRCVEAWSMVIPWNGFELGKLLERHKPTSRAKYVVFETLHDPDQLRGQRRDILDWPYHEALRMDEAMHPLTLLAVGLYGKEMPNQNGAPLRLVVPWKYGFKSIKSIVRIHLQEEKPTTVWEEKAPNEYGFYANVNPEVHHPRWNQARERRIGESGQRETTLFNGYGDEVAHLYAGMDLEKHF